MTASFVPAGFTVPVALAVGGTIRLEPLGPEHNARDHQAWMSSIDHIRTTPGFDHPDRDWPTAMSLAQNLDDLEMHARHFGERSGFTYSVLDGDEVVGCVYLYPSEREGHDAEVRSWVTASRVELDVVLWQAVTDWLGLCWPFTNPWYDRRDDPQGPQPS